MAEIGAFFLRTDTELIFKSRRVVPGRLLEAGFSLRFPRLAGSRAPTWWHAVGIFDWFGQVDL